jgi:hypothetical protein
MARRWLSIASAIELLTLLALVANLATVHHAGLASALGPVHGFCYLVTIVLAWQLPAPLPVHMRSLVPAVGGVLVLWATRSVPTPQAGARAAG